MEQPKMKILWIDDDINRLSLRPYIDEFHHNGFDVIGVENSDDIEKSIASNADILCVIVDLSMPIGKNFDVIEAKRGLRAGFAILQELNKNYRLSHIPKIVFSIAEDPKVYQYCVSNSIKYLLKYDYSPNTFVETIKNIINSSESESEFGMMSNSQYSLLDIQSYLISYMVHEFYSPIASIHYTVNRLLDKWNSILTEKYFFHYLKNIHELSALLKHQIDYARLLSAILKELPCSHKYHIKKHFIANIISQSKNVVKKQGINIENIVIDDCFPNWELYIDKEAFGVVFYNLLNNAIKYCIPKADFSIKIAGHESDQWLCIHVSDMGLGIDIEDKDNIFLMGYRGNNVTKFDNSGFGIGLFAAKRIVTDFGGEISVTSFCKPTTFEIKLPKILFNNEYTKNQKWNRV
jgi:signal transduction histidine kinase